MGNSPSGWSQIFNFWNKPAAALAFHVNDAPQWQPSDDAKNGINVVSLCVFFLTCFCIYISSMKCYMELPNYVKNDYTI